MRQNLSFLGQLSRIGDRDEEAVLFGHDDLPTARAGAGVNLPAGQGIDCFSPDDGRLPAGAELGRSVGHDRHPFGLWAAGLLSGLAGFCSIDPERSSTSFVSTISSRVSSNAPQLTGMGAWDGLFDLSDPLGHQMRRANHDGRIGIQQLDDRRPDDRLAQPHLPLQVADPILADRASHGGRRVALGRQQSRMVLSR